VSRQDEGRRALRDLTDLLTARGVKAVYHHAPAARGNGSGWIALAPAPGQHGTGDAVWYLPAGALVSGHPLDRPHLLWGRHLEHRAPAAARSAAADAITTQAPTVAELRASKDEPEMRTRATKAVE